MVMFCPLHQKLIMWITFYFQNFLMPYSFFIEILWNLLTKVISGTIILMDYCHHQFKLFFKFCNFHQSFFISQFILIPFEGVQNKNKNINKILSYFLVHVILKIMASLNDMVFNCGSLLWFKVGRFYLIYFGQNSNYLYAFIHK